MKKTKKIALLLVDDHPIVRKGIRSCLSAQPQIEVVDEACDGTEAIDKARKLLPDVILMDIDMPQMSGLEATRQLRKEKPDVKVVILTAHNKKEYVIQIIQSGARGYVLKDAPVADLVRSIESVHRGEPFFSADVSQLVLSEYMSEVQQKEEGHPMQKLTKREKEVLAMIAEGESNKEMANRLGVGVRTVETHRERVMKKLNIHSVAGLTKFAISNNVIHLTQ